MDQNLCCLQEKFIKDLFVSEGLGAVIDESSYGYARCSMEIEPRHCNALGIPMGGTIFTLAKDGKRICFYEVKVTDELGTEVAFVTVNGYVVHDNGRGET